MSFLGVKSKRKILDAGVITVLASSAYLIGFFQTQQMGALTFAFVLPCIFLIIMGSVHLILRTGRKFDERVHDPKNQLIEAVALAVTIGTSYYMALSGVKSVLRISSTGFALFFLLSLYLMAYRPNS